MTEILSTTYKLSLGGDQAITVRLDSPPAAGRALGRKQRVLILAHGAGNNLDFPLLAFIANHLASTGVAAVVRFNFPYAEKGLETPDRKEVLEATYLAVYEDVIRNVVRDDGVIVAGGKSLGARTASELVSRGPEQGGIRALGLVELGYPLHRPGHKEQLFLEPLRNIAVPSLFFVGTRDPLCDPELLAPVVAGLTRPGRIYVVRDGDHSFHPPAASDRKVEEVYREIAEETARFIEEVAST
ncbi:MAG: dienelactone hydrolase [Thermoleophilia bacterium]|nr:dienelactone hydrolase [Thermoleophilia bacterium]